VAWRLHGDLFLYGNLFFGFSIEIEYGDINDQGSAESPINIILITVNILTRVILILNIYIPQIRPNLGPQV
jgi:hypothetical protein